MWSADLGRKLNPLLGAIRLYPLAALTRKPEEGINARVWVFSSWEAVSEGRYRYCKGHRHRRAPSHILRCSYSGFLPFETPIGSLSTLRRWLPCATRT